MAVLSIVEDQNLYLNYWEKGRSVINIPLSVCCPKVVASMSIELSLDEQTLFVSGCDKMDINEGKPIISAVSFDNQLKEKFCLHLTDPKMRNIFKMKRLPKSSEDVLLVAGFHSISIISYDRKAETLQELKTLGGLHEGEIFDFTVFDNVIYSISGKDTHIHKY
jgi:hypothetical protein